ncbi:hypothetical protein IW152_004293 [Coemansia sp. BCRC 34962]|nr:hypothetical protein IW152_004293 [Coemansia sp. BCRC 34962]
MPRASLAQKKDFVTKAFCPRILALASAGVQDACTVNGFDSFADLLSPFGQDVLTQITIQDGQGAPYFLDKINVRFTTDFVTEKSPTHSSSDVDKPADPSFIGSDGVILDAAIADDISTWAPWYTLFRQQWVGDMQPSEHETFMLPVACLLVASGSEADPIGALRTLQASAAVQRVLSCSDGGTKTLFYYMLLHDGRDTAALQTIDLQFDQVRKTFGQNSALLKINTNTDLLGAADASERVKISSIWSSDIAATRPLVAHADTSYGEMLTMRDVAALRDAVKLMLVRSVVPHMQYVIRVLSDQTASERRGITGRLFSAGRRYLNTTSKAENTYVGTDGEMYYRHRSPEAMLRRLADCSFMLKDYRFAQSVYQIARRDFQSEKAWMCYAGVQEMIGVCKLLWEVQTTKAEFDSIFEDAMLTYTHKTRAPRRHFLAVRCTVVYYELLKHHRFYAFAPGALLRGPAFSPSLTALLNEQAAYSYLKAGSRPNVRKFAFYAMLASQSYQKAHMGDLASRCLRMVRVSLKSRSQEQARADIDGEKHHGKSTAEVRSPTMASMDEKAVAPNMAASDEANADKASVTAKTKWGAIDSYINHELGRQSMAAHNFDEAFQYFMALMGDEKTPPKLQSKYLQELLQLFLESNDQSTAGGGGAIKQTGAIELSIPSIDPQLARIIMSPELEGEDAMLEWRLDGSSPSKPSGGGSGLQLPRFCSVGEVVAVLLVVTNPLVIGVTLNNLTLECAFEATGDSVATDTLVDSALDISTVPTVILEGEQTTMVTVQITPRRAGSVSILGAKYLLCDILPTFKSLVLPGRRMNDTKEQRMSVVHTPDTTLGFRVSSDLPRLEITVDDLPDTLMSGSMHRACLRVANSGELPCHSVTMWVSHPSFVGVRPPRLCSDEDKAGDDTGMYVSLPDVTKHERIQVPNVLRDYSTFVLVGKQTDALGSSAHCVEPLGSLGPGEAFTVPIWIRGDRVGAHTLSLCIGASSAATVVPKDLAAMRSRRFEVDLLVTPSLRVNAFVRPSARNPRERLLGVEVENMQTELSVQLVQTTFTSGFYELEPVSNSLGSEPHKALVGPRQSISMVYRVRPHDMTQSGKLLRSNSPEMFAVRALRQFIYSSEKPASAPEPIDLIYSNSVFAGKGIDCKHRSLQSYIMRAQAHRRRNALRSGYPLIPDNYHSAMFPLFESFSIDFVLFWSQVGGPGRAGHHSISGIDLGVPHDYLVEGLSPPTEGAARTWLSDTMHDREALIHSIASRSEAALRSERPLDVMIRVDTAQKSGSLYVADVAISVFNHSWRYGYQFTLDLLSPHELGQFLAEGAKMDCSGSRAAWSWLGETSYSSSVEPHGLAVLHARLSCYAPGMIDVAMWRLQASASLEPSGAAVSTVFSSRNLDCALYPTQPHFVHVGAI